jgi:hypothetical protein
MHKADSPLNPAASMVSTSARKDFWAFWDGGDNEMACIIYGVGVAVWVGVRECCV